MAFEPRGYPGYLFDLDGTLIDSAPDICVAVNHALERYGYGPAPESLVRHWVGLGGRHCIEQALAHANTGGSTSAHTPTGQIDGHAAGGGGSAKPPGSAQPLVEPALVDAMLDGFLDHYRAHIADRSRPYPHVTESLRRLSERNAKLAVVTNKRIELTRKLLDELELTPWFDAIVGGDTVARPKPAPDPILFACDRIGLTPRDVLFVGDSPTDVDASRAAGCTVVCVPYGYNQGIAPQRLGADAIISSLRALL